MSLNDLTKMMIDEFKAAREKLESVEEKVTKSQTDIAVVKTEMKNMKEQRSREESQIIKLEKRVDAIESRKSDPGQQTPALTIQGMKKLLPYLLLGALSIWGIVTEVLKKLEL